MAAYKVYDIATNESESLQEKQFLELDEPIVKSNTADQVPASSATAEARPRPSVEVQFVSASHSSGGLNSDSPHERDYPASDTAKLLQPVRLDADSEEMHFSGRKGLSPLSPMANRSRLLSESGAGSSRTYGGKNAALSLPPSPSGNDLEGGDMEMVNIKRKVSSRLRSPAMMRSFAWVILWYLFSLCLSLYNKFLIGAKHGKFPAPLLMTAIHFTMQWTISAFLLTFVCTSWAPTSKLSWRDYLVRVVPTALTTATDIGISNRSLVLITLTFYTMCKSSAPVFLLIFAFAFKLETPSLRLLGVIVVVSVGVLLTVAGETEFELVGFILVMIGAVMSGLRWVLVQVLLQKEKLGLTNPLVTLYYLTPVMSIACGLFSLWSEPWSALAKSPYFDTWPHFYTSAAIMVLGGALAFCMIMTEFLLISETSALTFSVAGTVKEGLTILVSHFIFNDKFTLVNVLGLVIILFGVSLFNVYKYYKMLDKKSEDYAEDGGAEGEALEQELLVQHNKLSPSGSELRPDGGGEASHSHKAFSESRSPSPRISVMTPKFQSGQLSSRGAADSMGSGSASSSAAAADDAQWRSPRALASPGSRGLHERHVDEFVLQVRRMDSVEASA